MPEPVVEASGVSHRYRTRTALRDVTFTLEGGVLGVLGPNGAGKSTLLKLVTTAQRPQRGHWRILGLDP